MFALCLALMAWNGILVIHAALRSAHGEETIEENLSGYYLSLETLQKQKRAPRIQSLREITPATENTSPPQSYSQEEITNKSHLHRAALQVLSDTGKVDLIAAAFVPTNPAPTFPRRFNRPLAPCG